MTVCAENPVLALWVVLGADSESELVIFHHVEFQPQTFPMKEKDLTKHSPSLHVNLHVLDECPVPLDKNSPPEHKLDKKTSLIRRRVIFMYPGRKRLRRTSPWIDPSNIIEGSRTQHRAMVIVGEPSSTKDPKTYGKILGRVDENEWLMAVLKLL
ncbi:uncharacterized protein VP01_6354g1 [Puccinia sorghi]|uniref:Uncharacterized protein n=1 Tax=Puccinia sorghi TaxID=27349 RepID=A0A0L6UG47_9BASI|nr:uncharacterized protein VP01_6354g1 [Puccinia sorghi]